MDKLDTAIIIIYIFVISNVGTCVICMPFFEKVKFSWIVLCFTETERERERERVKLNILCIYVFIMSSLRYYNEVLCFSILF